MHVRSILGWDLKDLANREQVCHGVLHEEPSRLSLEGTSFTVIAHVFVEVGSSTKTGCHEDS